VLGYYPSPADSSYLSHPFDVILTVRHTDRCNVASVPIVLTESDGTNRNNNDTIIIPLADAAGRWLGKGSYGIYTLEKTLHHNFRIPEGYEILIKPAFEKTKIKGITDIGISLTTPYI